MVNLDAFRDAGIDYEKGIERFMGNEELYLDFLMRFLYDSSFQEFCAGVAMEDMEMAEKALYTLRGTIANLSMDRLLSAIDLALEAIHNKKEYVEIQNAIDEVNLAYQMVCDAISS